MRPSGSPGTHPVQLRPPLSNGTGRSRLATRNVTTLARTKRSRSVLLPPRSGHPVGEVSSPVTGAPGAGRRCLTGGRSADSLGRSMPETRAKAKARGRSAGPRDRRPSKEPKATDVRPDQACVFLRRRQGRRQGRHEGPPRRQGREPRRDERDRHPRPPRVHDHHRGLRRVPTRTARSCPRQVLPGDPGRGQGGWKDLYGAKFGDPARTLSS